MTESEQLKSQLAQIEKRFYADDVPATALKSLSVEIRELRHLIAAAEAAERKDSRVVASVADAAIS